MSSLLDSNISDQIVSDLSSSVEMNDDDDNNIINLNIQSGGSKNNTSKSVKKNKLSQNKGTVKKKNTKNDKKNNDVEKKTNNTIDENEDNIVVDYRDMILSYDATKNKSIKRFTTSEKAVILGKRVTQLAGGANAYIEVRPGMSIREIAEEEFIQKKIPYMVERPYGDGTELWRMKDVEVKL
jgi:DNA-directed RNA polymerase subunit K/omega